MSNERNSRVVLLTGAAGGIGRVIAQALLADGHAVAAVDRDAGGLEHLARLAAERGAAERLQTIPADLATEAGCNDAVAQACGRFGTIGAVINNAGIGMSSIRPDAEARHPGIGELTPEIFDRFFAIFVRAPVMLTRAALPFMRERQFGRIVNNTTSYLTMLRVLPLRRRQGGVGIPVGGMGEGARGLRHHGERAGARGTHRYAADRRRIRLAA
jgi:NAD(P)-dependent dehydrogenase (short-subunit alcohol dehydrogenase family)